MKECTCLCVRGGETNKWAIAEGKSSERSELFGINANHILYQGIIQLRSMNLWPNLRLNANNIQFEPINKNVQKKSRLRKRPSNPKQRPYYCDPKISVIVVVLSSFDAFIWFSLFISLAIEKISTMVDSVQWAYRVESHPLSLPTLWRFGWLVDIHSKNKPRMKL